MKPTLNSIAKELSHIQDSREFLLKNTREVIILCSRAIISVHREDRKSAMSNLRRAGVLLRKYQKKATGELRRYIIIAEQEFVEAACLVAIFQKEEIPTDKKLKVLPESYILGLLDCIGELKRMVFDKIRKGDISEATRIFEIMENLYLQIYPFSMYDKIVKEARRKIDVNRILIEDARGAITEEKRRSDLINILNKLQADGF
jgi:translin